MRIFDVLERHGYSTKYQIVSNGTVWSKRTGYDILGDRELLHTPIKGITHCQGNYIMIEVEN